LYERVTLYRKSLNDWGYVESSVEFGRTIRITHRISVKTM
jgi:hypothetical protein